MTSMLFRLIRAVAPTLMSAALVTGVAAATAAEPPTLTRCGWFSNPTPQNAWLRDRRMDDQRAGRPPGRRRLAVVHAVAVDQNERQLRLRLRVHVGRVGCEDARDHDHQIGARPAARGMPQGSHAQEAVVICAHAEFASRLSGYWPMVGLLPRRLPRPSIGRVGGRSTPGGAPLPTS